MPRKTKEVENLEEKKTRTTNKQTKSKELKKETTKKKVNSSKKKNSSKTTTNKTKRTSTSKSTTKNKRNTSKVSSSKKISVKKSSEVLEYYDLPHHYNDTLVKILYQTPTKLFVYWDISDEQKELYKKNFGEDFFYSTKPVLIIHNETKNYSFEVEINDFANSWYLNIPDAKCNYSIELGRRSKNVNTYSIPNNYIYIASSNKIESPNDHILFEKEQKMVYFKNVKSNVVTSKKIAQLSFIQNIGRIYNIYEQYKEIYKGQDEIFNNNPSSKFI